MKPTHDRTQAANHDGVWYAREAGNSFDAPWRDVVSVEEQEIYRSAGYTGVRRLGLRPALIIIDMNRHFLGDKPEPISESQKHFPYSCGLAGWNALSHIMRLRARARDIGIPIFFTTGKWRERELGQMSIKNERTQEWLDDQDWRSDIVPELAPLPGEIVIYKHRPSSFFGTPLASYLVAQRVDTLLLAGNSTSGCVRATAVDSYSLGYYTGIPATCVFDRIPISHKVALFDMTHKYAAVLDDLDLKEYLDQVAERSGRNETLNA